MIQEQSFDVIIFQDYNKGLLTKTVIQKAIKAAKNKGIPTIVDPKKENFFSYQSVDIFKPNLQEFKEVFKSLSPEEVAFPRSCNNLSKYTNSSNIYNKGTPIHVKGALIYNHNIYRHKLSAKYPIIKDGDKIKFLMLKQPNVVKDTVISFATKIPYEFDLHKYVDYDTQFEKTFTDPLRFILDSIGWKLEREATLEAFFG